jgi:hypothetical protein
MMGARLAQNSGVFFYTAREVPLDDDDIRLGNSLRKAGHHSILPAISAQQMESGLPGRANDAHARTGVFPYIPRIRNQFWARLFFSLLIQYPFWNWVVLHGFLR